MIARKGVEFRRIATAFNHAVFAESDNQEAKELLAETCGRLGCQAESGPWRIRRRHMQLSHAERALHGNDLQMSGDSRIARYM